MPKKKSRLPLKACASSKLSGPNIEIGRIDGLVPQAVVHSKRRAEVKHQIFPLDLFSRFLIGEALLKKKLNVIHPTAITFSYGGEAWQLYRQAR